MCDRSSESEEGSLMKVLTKMRYAAPLVVAAALALAACGSGGSKSSSSGSPQPTSSGGGAAQSAPLSGTIAAKKVGNLGTVLVDSSMGMTVYTPDQEASGKILCSGECTSFWPPVVAGSSTPTAGSGVTGTLGVVTRPDGTRQVTINGKPLYMFSEDKGAGGTAGNGIKDSFSGQNFSWHAVKPDGSVVAASSGSSGGGAGNTTPTTSSGGSYGGGGGGGGGGSYGY